MKNPHALIVAQFLLKAAGSRLKLKSVFSGIQHGGSSYVRFRVMGRRGISPKLTMPVISGIDGVRVLSLLDETNAKKRDWLLNGQAGCGMNQIAHYGDCGRAWFKFDKDDVLSFFDHKNADEMPDWIARRYSDAQDTPVLVIRDGNDFPHEIVLPSITEAQVLVGALDSLDPVWVGPKEANYKRMVETFGLGLKFGTGKLKGYMYASNLKSLNVIGEGDAKSAA